MKPSKQSTDPKGRRFINLWSGILINPTLYTHLPDPEATRLRSLLRTPSHIQNSIRIELTQI